MGASVFSVGRLWAVWRNTALEVARNRAFGGIVFAAIVLLLFSQVLSELAVTGQGPRVVLGFGLFAISLFAAATAIVMGAVLLHKEVERRTIQTIISKPIHRYEFLLGKAFGMVTVVLGEIALLALLWIGVLMLQGAEPTVEHLKALILTGFEAALITSVSVMFAAFSSPILSALFASSVFLIGRWVYLIAEMLQSDRGFFSRNPGLRPFGEAIVAIWPDLSVFDASRELLLGVQTSWTYLAYAGVYALGYILVFLVLAVIAFQRRDLV